MISKTIFPFELWKPSLQSFHFPDYLYTGKKRRSDILSLLRRKWSYCSQVWLNVASLLLGIIYSPFFLLILLCVLYLYTPCFFQCKQRLYVCYSFGLEYPSLFLLPKQNPRFWDTFFKLS